jgi:molybdopterin-binding protein
MKVSARNQVRGTVQATTSEAVDELDLKVGGQVHAVIKASDVMVGKD